MREGRLFARAAEQMLGYLERSPQPFDADGWYDTGDLVEEKDGMIRIAGRVSEVHVGGHKVMPGEVENCLMQAENVLDAVVEGRRTRSRDRQWLPGWCCGRGRTQRLPRIGFCRSAGPGWSRTSCRLCFSSRPGSRSIRPASVRAAEHVMSGRVVLISGGSRGLGQALVTHFLARGDRVACFSRSATAFTAGLQSDDPDEARFLWRAVDGSDATRSRRSCGPWRGTGRRWRC